MRNRTLPRWPRWPRCWWAAASRPRHLRLVAHCRRPGLARAGTIAPVAPSPRRSRRQEPDRDRRSEQQHPLNDPAAKVHLRFFNLDEAGTGSVRGPTRSTTGKGLPAAFYVAYPTFDKPGNWGIEIQVQLPGQAQPIVSKQRLEVKPSSEVPSIGQPAIVARTLTTADVPSIAQLSSGPNADPAMYQISLDQA
ncbi:MAG: hypothetical protein U0Z44_07390 [Kouleothrix sp.]